jgi:Delta3-Delta2-enoyl-CoA isomerase
MSSSLIPLEWKNLSLERRGNIFILTLQKSPENRLDSAFCQEIIRAFNYVRKALGENSDGAIITRGSDAKFWCTGLDLDESDRDPFAYSDGFFPLLAAVMDFPFPTIALITGHTFGGACPFALSHDYRVMNSKRGFISMVRSDCDERGFISAAADRV